MEVHNVVTSHFREDTRYHPSSKQTLWLQPASATLEGGNNRGTPTGKTHSCIPQIHGARTLTQLMSRPRLIEINSVWTLSSLRKAMLSQAVTSTVNQWHSLLGIIFLKWASCRTSGRKPTEQAVPSFLVKHPGLNSGYDYQYACASLASENRSCLIQPA